MAGEAIDEISAETVCLLHAIVVIEAGCKQEYIVHVCLPARAAIPSRVLRDPHEILMVPLDCELKTVRGALRLCANVAQQLPNRALRAEAKAKAKAKVSVQAASPVWRCLV